MQTVLLCEVICLVVWQSLDSGEFFCDSNPWYPKNSWDHGVSSFGANQQQPTPWRDQRLCAPTMCPKYSKLCYSKEAFVHLVEGWCRWRMFNIELISLIWRVGWTQGCHPQILALFCVEVDKKSGSLVFGMWPMCLFNRRASPRI